MKIIEPSFKIEYCPEECFVMYHLEQAARTCYKSEANASPVSASKLLARIIRQGHESVLEHISITVRIVCDRGVTHELVRHRLASFSQESTRYCNYADEKFERELTFIRPPQCSAQLLGQHTIMWNLQSLTASRKEGLINPELCPSDNVFFWALAVVERDYIALLGCGWSPQEARAVLPNSLKTELVMTANIREWRHIFKLRCAKDAHPQMRQIMVPMLAAFTELIPVLFDDLVATGDSHDK